MTRDTAETVSHSVNTAARQGNEHGRTDKKIAKPTRENGSQASKQTGSPHIVQLEGLMPVETSPTSTPTHKQGNAGTVMNPTQVAPEETVPLRVGEKVVAPLVEMEKVDDTTMDEVDLGDGSGEGLPQTKTKGTARNGDKPDKDKNRNDTRHKLHLGQSGQGDSIELDDAVGTAISATGPGVDEPDKASVYSLYMEKDFRYYFQHPYFRLFVAYFVTFCNFLIYAEDPVAHSRKESNIPVIGNCFAFVCTKYPPNAWSFLKVVLWLVGTVVGLIVGKIFFHTFLFNRIFRLKMFTDDKGSWMTMFLTTILSVFIFSYIYNLFLLIGGDATDAWHISPWMTISNSIFMKAAATGTWCGDFFTAWMVTDMMLQEKLYPLWAKKPREWWNTGIRRIVLFWIVVVVSSFIVIFVIATDYIQWDKLNRDFLHSNELSRAFLASFILVCDIVIVMQDWDFPHFISAIDIKLPGLNTAHIRFKIPRLLRRLEYWHVHISGKWFNYGILFIVILLDLNMWKNQIFYAPFDYGQYVDTKGRIHSVSDDYSLVNFNETLLSFDYRNATIDPITGKRYIELDTVMNARYRNYSLGVRAIAFVPSIAVFIIFGVLIWMFGRLPKPTKEDPYGGRLKKRKKRRFSARHLMRSFRKNAQVVLTAVRWRRGTHNRGGEDGVDGGQAGTGGGGREQGRGKEGTVVATVENEKTTDTDIGGSGDAGPRRDKTTIV